MTKDVTPILENTTMQGVYDENGKLTNYIISPCDGYVLHEITRDEPIIDEETMEETGEVKKGYTKGVVTTIANYDFEKNPREIYAVEG